MIKKAMYDKKEILSYAFFIIVAFSVVYFSIVSNGYMYMYIDIGADTYCSYWPSLAYVQHWLTHMSAWDMSLGLGSAVITQLCYFLIDPFNIIILCFDSYNMYIGILISLMLKFLVLSIFSYKYIRIVHVSENWIINNIASTCIVFSGWFVGWGQHYNYSTMFVFFILILYLFEKWLQQEYWLGFVFALAYLCMMTPYYGYMILLFLVIYYILRYLEVFNKFQIKEFIQHGVRTAAVCILGVGCSFVLFLPEVEEILGSPRVSGGFDFGIRLASVMEYRSAISRLLSNNILGINGDFVGYANYYEAPFLFVGLLFPIVLPNLYLKEFRKKTYVICGGLCIIAFVFMQDAALIFNMFSTITYRWTFIFVPVFTLALGKALDIFWQKDEKNKVSKLAVLFWMSIDLGLFVYLYMRNINVSKEILYVVAVNAILFILYQIGLYNLKKIGLWTVYLITLIDLVWNAYVSVNWRALIPISNRESMEYFDETSKIAYDLSTADGSFYRIYKKYAYIDLNDSMFQHYAGERFYSSTLTDSYWNLQNIFDLRIKNSNYLRGFDDKQSLRDINCGKYMITNEPREYYGYEMMGQDGGKYIYLNDNSHNFGFVYDSAISMADFMNLPQYEQQDIVYEAAIIEDDDVNNLQGIQFVANSTCSNLLSISYTMKLMEDAIEITLENPNSNPVLLEIVATEEIPGIVSGYIYSAEIGEEYSPYDYIDISIGPGERKIYVVNALELEKIKINLSPDYVAQLSIYEKDMSAIDECVVRNNSNSLNIDEQTNDYISGKIYTENDAILFLPVIYNHNWHVYVNGIEKKTLKIDGGFSGVKLDAGENEVIFKYEAKMYMYGAVISILCILIAFTIWGLQRKIYREKR